jgi:hypothetical protein
MQSTFPMFMRACTIWCLILVLAFVNGAARELFLIPRLGRAPGLFLSGILLSAVIVVLAFVSVRWIRPRSAADAWRVGGFWLAATIAFEFGLGWTQQKSLGEMLGAYSFRGGNTWLLVVLTTMLAPRFAYQWRRPVGPEHVE